MSLSRAFTTRRLRMSMEPSSSDQAKGSQRQTLRHKISAPMQLIHTTNLLSYNAPDLPRPVLNNSPVSTSYSYRSEHDSDSIATAETSPPGSPDGAKSARGSSPVPKPGHMSDNHYRVPATPLFPPESDFPPAIPRRSPSHTKKNSFDNLNRSASVSRISRDSQGFARPARTFSRSPSTSTRASSISAVSSTRSLKHAFPPSPSTPVASDFELPTKEAHPFGPELAQVTELAEEWNGKMEMMDEDADYLQSRGLSKLSADDYLGVIHDLATYFFPENAAGPSLVWI